MCEHTNGGYRTYLGHDLLHPSNRGLTRHQQMESSGAPPNARDPCCEHNDQDRLPGAGARCRHLAVETGIQLQGPTNPPSQTAWRRGLAVHQSAQRNRLRRALNTTST